MNERIESRILEKYDLNLLSIKKISNKCYIIKCNDGNEYVLKESDYFSEEKYNFLYNQGVDNILYPLINKDNKFITQGLDDSFCLLKIIKNDKVIPEIKTVKLLEQLDIIHNKTSFNKELTVINSRKKMEEIYNYLQYKFNVLEAFIRTIESQNFDEFSIPILKNYHIILDAKKYMGDIQKSIIIDIKKKRIVTFSFIHNNPKIDHLVMNGGNCYLISIEKSKIGIPSYDIAKYYLENEYLNVDIKGLIKDYFLRYNDDFYFRYFTFIVLLVYIKDIVIVDKDYISSQSFINISSSIKKFMEMFDLSNYKAKDNE